MYANDEALRLFDQALEAGTRAGLDPREVALIHRDRGEVHQLQGAYQAALTDFEQALALARQASDRGLEALLENRVGFVHHRELRLPEAEEHFTLAVALAREAGDRRTLGLSLLDLANVAWDRGVMAPDDPMLQEGIDLLRQAGDLSGVARGLNLLGMEHFAMADAAEALAAVEEALAVAREAGDKSKEATSLSYLSVINAYLGRYQEAIRFGQEALALAEAIGDRRRMGFAVSFIAPAHMALGQWGEAIRLAEGIVDAVREFAKIHLPFALMSLARLVYELGDEQRARALVAEALGVPIPPNPGWQQAVLLSKYLLARLEEDRVEADRVLDELLGLPWGVFIPDDGEVMLPVGEALFEGGHIEELRAFVTARRPEVTRWGAPPYLAALAILEALLAHRDGRLEEAAARLEEAIARSRSVGNVPLEIRAYELRFEFFHRPEDREMRRRLLRRVAESLPDDLRAIFLASPRAAVLRDS